MRNTRRHRGFFMVAEVMIAVAILMAIALATSYVLTQLRGTTERLAERRALVADAEALLLDAQRGLSSEPAEGLRVTWRVHDIGAGGPDQPPVDGEPRWVTLTLEREGRAVSLSGIVAGRHLAKLDINGGNEP